MVRNTRFHGRGNPQRLVNPGEVVVHEVEADRVRVVLDLLGEAVGQAREASHSHPHREVLTLDVGRADERVVGIASDETLLDPGADRG